MQMDDRNQVSITLPESLNRKVAQFRNRLWALKIWEAAALGAIGVLVGFFAVFSLDRFGDTPAWARLSILAGAVICVMAIPMAIQRWVVRRRNLGQVADLLRQTDPSVGDRLVGVIGLADSATEQNRSPVLVKAAIEQVANDVESRDLRGAVPNQRHVRRTSVAAVLALGLGCLAGISAAATGNAWQRYLNPFTETSRYTFTQFESLPDEIVVAHGEPFNISARLASTTETKPDVASAGFGESGWSSAARDGYLYQFRMPGQFESDDLQITAGDFEASTKLIPTVRPELSDMEAKIRLPDYLQRPAPITRNVRGGSLSVLRGSEVELKITTSRDLKSASLGEETIDVDKNQFAIAPRIVDREQLVTMSWRDIHDLAPSQPFELKFSGVNDEAPSINTDGLPRRKILLDSEVLSFTTFARDDYGVRRVGLEWLQVDDEGNTIPGGEKLIGAGNPDADVLELAGTFTAHELPLISKTVAVRLYAEDYLPERPRTYGATSVFTVLTADEHAIWIANELARWHRQSLDVRDRELKLFETNKELRRLSNSDLDNPETRQKLKAQARGEQANGRRLDSLVRNGEGLLKEAMRNPGIGVGHLEEWAAMMQILQDISGNRMPSVADLLKDASKAESLARKSGSKAGPKAGENKLNQQGKSNTEIVGKPKPAVPTLTDIESTQNDLSEAKEGEPTKKKAKKARLTIPTTRLAGNGKSDKKAPEPDPNAVDEAVEEQEDLLAEFEKVAGKLNELLANMEGSTLVKRLKAASRNQEGVATQLASITTSTFGVAKRSVPVDAEQVLTSLQSKESTYGTEVSYIMDDMAAYFDRSRFAQFKTVLDDMQAEDVTTALEELAKEIPDQAGLSMALAEYWCETLDRWAEDLVEPSMCGACPGCKSKASLPPSIVLEVLQILEGEVKLRESTREGEQARPGLEPNDYATRAAKLSLQQDGFRTRVDNVIERILELPEPETNFGKELKQLAAVSKVMDEATEILARPDTGVAAIGAETEAIELLLETKRLCQNGGGGGGSSPGGGGGGDTDAPALAMVGSGINAKEIREDMRAETTTGKAGRSLPEEFRSGLDQYFHQIGEWQE